MNVAHEAVTLLKNSSSRVATKRDTSHGNGKRRIFHRALQSNDRRCLSSIKIIALINTIVPRLHVLDDEIRTFSAVKTSPTWTTRIVLSFQKKVSETTWFSGQNTFIDNWHIVDGISGNILYTFPRIFQKYVKSTKMENVGLLLSPSKFKKLKLRSFIIAVLSKDKTVISKKNQIFVIIAWTVNMLIMTGWRVLVLFLHCPDGVSTRCDAMRAPLERNKRPRACTRSYEAKKQEKRGSGATTCNKTWGEPTELRLCTYKNRPFWLRLENESFADVTCIYYHVLCMYNLARKF